MIQRPLLRPYLTAVILSRWQLSTGGPLTASAKRIAALKQADIRVYGADGVLTLVGDC